MAMKVTWTEDRMGYLYVSPVSDKINRKIERHLADFKVGWDGSVLFQTDYEAENAKEQFLSKAQRNEIDSGWSVTMLIDPWVYFTWVGYDAHEAL